MKSRATVILQQQGCRIKLFAFTTDVYQRHESLGIIGWAWQHWCIRKTRRICHTENYVLSAKVNPI